MSPNSTTSITVAISLIIALSSFTILSLNIPTDVTVSREQAIAIVKASPKVDPGKTIVKDEWLMSAELRYLPINWSNYLLWSGSHSRIYVSTSPVGDINPYWFIEYSSPLSRIQTYGSYIVDARTGELMLAMEGSGGPFPSSDFSTSTTPAYANDPYFPVEIKQGQSVEVTVRFMAQPSYDASLPMSVRVTAVPKGFEVTQNTTSGILRTGGTLVIKVVISSSADALGSNPPPFNSTPPHLEIEEGLIGTIYGDSIYVQLVS